MPRNTSTTPTASATTTDPSLSAATALAGDIAAEYLDLRQLAHALHVTPRTLARWEALQVGPPRVMLGKRSLYSRTAVKQWFSDGGARAALRRKRGVRRAR